MAFTHMDTATSFQLVSYPNDSVSSILCYVCTVTDKATGDIADVQLGGRGSGRPIFTTRGSGASDVENIVNVRLYLSWLSTFHFLCYRMFR